jgi:hypothetical protein
MYICQNKNNEIMNYENKIANFLLQKGFDKKEIIHFINRCREVPMMGSVMHIKGLSSSFDSFLKDVIWNKNIKNNYQIDGICFKEYLSKTFNL